MARVLIKLKVDGVQLDGKPFNAIYGDYTVNDKHDYTVGDYKILSENIASLYFGEIPETASIIKLLRV